MLGLEQIIRRRLWAILDGFAWIIRILVRLLILLWVVGFFWYIASTPITPINSTEKADAIVVLTGGNLRVTTGLSLLKKDFAPLLYVSGVHPSTSVAQILDIGNLSPNTYHNRIALGTEARTTYGNAKETAAWIIKNKVSTIWLVTSHYHMKRSLLEFHRALPNIKIIPYPVQSDHSGRFWWWHPKTLSLLFSEYHKYLFILLREIGS